MPGMCIQLGRCMKAAEKELQQAQFNVGFFYEKGRGCEIDIFSTSNALVPEISGTRISICY